MAIHQPANPRPDPTVRSHETLQPFRGCCWWEPGGWRVGRVGDANTERCEVWPTDDGDQHVRVFVGDAEMAAVRVRPLPLWKPRHKV